VLQWARANGCEANHTTCAFAARGGHLAVLQWARADGCPDRGVHGSSLLGLYFSQRVPDSHQRVLSVSLGLYFSQSDTDSP
jgi:hypothetical protein